MTSEQIQRQAQNDIAFQKYVKSTILKKNANNKRVEMWQPKSEIRFHVNWITAAKNQSLF